MHIRAGLRVQENREAGPLPQQDPTPARLAEAEAFAFDLDGTIYLQGTPLPGALELLAELRSRHVPHLFVTNNSSVSGDRYLRKLTDLGLQIDRDQILTSADVAKAHLLDKGLRRPWLLATDEVRADFAQTGLVHTEDMPDSVLLAFDTSLTYAKLASATRLIAAGLPYLATHPDVTCPVPGGFLPDTGSFIELFHAATGRRPEILGKPMAGMSAEVTRRLGCPPSRIAFVGDRLETDIRMASDAGFVSVLTLTGVTGTADLNDSGLTPDVTVAGMTELRQLLGTGALA